MLDCLDEGPESSTEDISSRPYSPSLSSSNEDILKPVDRIGERGDCDLMDHRMEHPDWILHAAMQNVDSNGMKFPPQFAAGSKLNSIDLEYLKDLELSSTTESQAPSTLAPNNKEVESSTSFEYLENDLIQSPFQREIQRLLESSASKIPVPINRTSAAAINSIANNSKMNLNLNNSNNHAGSSSNDAKSSNMQQYEFEPMQKPCNYMQVMLSGGSAIATVNGKHPVGLEAIKEIAKNTATSDSSQM